MISRLNYRLFFACMALSQISGLPVTPPLQICGIATDAYGFLTG
jgi:hypothetical protein